MSEGKNSEVGMPKSEVSYSAFDTPHSALNELIIDY